MNELAYIISLTETLSNFVNTTETKSKKVFARLLFYLLIDDRLISRSRLPLKQGEKNVYIASVKLLFEKYKFDSIEKYAMQFLRDENPELMPGYEFILSSINPNDLDEKQIRRISSIQNTSILKEKLILHFLFGNPYSPSPRLKDYELLTNLSLEIFGNPEEEIKTTLLEILSASSNRLQRFHRSPEATNMYIELTPAIRTAIENQNQDRNRFDRLLQVLNDLQN
jgi:hypothetical protein